MKLQDAEKAGKLAEKLKIKTKNLEILRKTHKIYIRLLSGPYYNDKVDESFYVEEFEQRYVYEDGKGGRDELVPAETRELFELIKQVIVDFQTKSIERITKELEEL